MASNPSLVMRVLSASVAVSNRAANIIRNVLTKGDLGIVEKGKNDLQTEADRSAQRCIVASLHKQFPNVAIFGEEQLDPQEKIPKDFIEQGFDAEVLKHTCPEYLKETKDEDVVIWVDPLDGTAEFTQGYLDHVTVLIGISVKGNAVAGVIHQPWFNFDKPGLPLGRCIWGVIGLGSFGFERETPPANKIIITTSRSHSDRMVTEAVESCNPDEIVRVGGAGHKVLLLIEGKVHAYVFASKGCKKWDTCAPEAILHAVGGTLTDFHGIRMNYSADVQRKNTGGVLATVANHEKFLSCIPEHIRDCMDKSSEAPPLDFKGVVVCGGADLKEAKKDSASVPDKNPAANNATGSTSNNAETNHKEPSDSVPNEYGNTKL
ncbi:3'(2'),5'-bisphosphate nucleotidase 1-like [Saccostrea cucullata]|uniref:3'(2'),5'-bisphosphate nucleotidase 1-like n=1 Tax=Saccostrea cuccullata TaxID=36930 RepID=UPI002ED441B3